MPRRFAAIAAAAVLAATAAGAKADEILFKNGDRLTGKVVSMEGGKLKIKSAIAGDVTVEMKNVRTFSTDGPIEVRMKSGGVGKRQVAPAGEGEVAIRDDGPPAPTKATAKPATTRPATLPTARPAAAPATQPTTGPTTRPTTSP